MRDLQYLYYFENLLTEANNDLVRAAKNQGRLALGSVCAQIPEPLLNLPGCFAVRLRAPRTGSLDISTYYMSSIMCECCRALVERAFEGGYNFLDGILAPDACAQMNRCVENIERLKLIQGDKVLITYSDVPMKTTGSALAHYVMQMREHVLLPLQENFGIEISDEALRRSVELQNEISKLIQEMGKYRKEENPRITAYEFFTFCMASYCCPQDMILDKLRETVEELKTREPDRKKSYRARVVLVGSEIDDGDLIRLIEESGAYICADRFCFGSFPGRSIIELNDEEDVLTQICRHYLTVGQCPRFMNTEKIEERLYYVDALAKEYKADGIIYEQIKFCDYWGYERASASHRMREEFAYPTLSVDRSYVVGHSGQLRTRVQAFVESIEIKKIQAAKAEQATKEKLMAGEIQEIIDLATTKELKKKEA